MENELYIEKVLSIVKELRKRDTKWKVAKNVMKSCHLPISGGWDSTLSLMRDRLVEEAQDRQLTLFDFLEDKYRKIRDKYIEYLLTYQKTVRFYRVTEEKISDLVSIIKTHCLETENEFRKTYPLSVSESALRELDIEPEIISIESNEYGFGIVIASKKVISQRVNIEPDDFKDEAKAKLEDFNSIVGIKDFVGQFFDVVFINTKHNLIEIRLDTYESFSAEDQEESFDKVISCFNQFVKDINGNINFLRECINCFPLVENLYKSTQEGKVGELSFTTDQGSIKHEKMRRGSCDLRDELYHRAGRQALEKFDQSINPYRIAILWDVPLIIENEEEVTSSPELFIRGRAVHLSDPEKTLDEVSILNCFCLEDYDFVINKIQKYL